MECGQFFTSESNTTLCKEEPQACLIQDPMGSSDHDLAARRDNGSSEVAVKIVLQESPNPPLKLTEAPLVPSSASLKVVLKEALGLVSKERDAGAAGANKAASFELQETPADKRH